MNNQDYFNVGNRFGVDVPALKSVVRVESSGSGFFIDWDMKQRIKIQFEPTHFVKQCLRLGIKASKVSVGKNVWAVYAGSKLILRNGVEGQQNEWNAFNKAWTVSPEAAMMATSWGLGQIMGFNYSLAGYLSVSEMVASFKEAEVNQFTGMMNFVSKAGLMGYLRNHDWVKFANGYNGEAYKLMKYDTKLAEAYKEFNIGYNK